MEEDPLGAAIEAVTPAAVASDPVSEALDRIYASNDSQLRRTFLQTADTNPDTAAEARRLSLKFGAPPAIIERNLDDYRKREAGDHPFDAIQKDTPALAAWATDPAHAAIAKDDLEPLGNLEWVLTAMPRAFQQQIDQLRYSELRYKSLFSPLTQEESDRAQSYKYASTLGGELGAGKSWFRKAITGSAQLLAQAVEPIKYSIAGLGEGAIVGGAAGAWAGPGAGVTAAGGAIAGASMGGVYGVIKTTAQQETTQAYDELIDMRDEHGQPLDPQVAKVAALAVGGLNGLIELAGAEAFLKTIPGLDKLRGKLSRSAVKEALRSPSLRSAFGALAKEYAGTLTAETATEVAQRAVAIAGEELSKIVSTGGTVGGQLEPGTIDLFKQPRVANADGSISTVDSVSVGIDGKEVLLSRVTPDGRHLSTEQALDEYRKTGQHLGIFDTPAAADSFAGKLHEDYAAGRYDAASQMRSAGQVGTELLDEAIGAVQSFALGIAPGPAMTFLHDAARARRASSGPTFFKALGEGVTQSKTFERLPEAAQRFVEQATKDGPIATVYAPIDAWREYWQSKGIDAGEMAAQVTGNRAAYDAATMSGEDLAIPTARYAATLAGTEHNTFFANELRLGPDEMNGRESAAFVEQLQAAADQVRDAAAGTPANVIRDQVLNRMEGAGVPRATAEAYADLFSSATGEAGVFAGGAVTRAGMDPAEFYRQYGLKVERADFAAAAPAADVPRGTTAQARAEPTAVFLAHGPDGPLYNIIGGEKDRSTVSATGLEAAGIPVPETPPAPAAGERLSGDQIRATALAARAAAQAAATATPAAGEPAAAPAAEPLPAGTQSRLRDLGLSEAAIAGLTIDQANTTLERRTTPGEPPAGVERRIVQPMGKPAGMTDAEYADLNSRVADAYARAAAKRAERAAVIDTPAKRAERAAAAEAIVDNKAAAPQTGEPDGSPRLESRAAARLRRIATGDGIAASAPRSERKESPAQRAARAEAHFAAVFEFVFANARQLDPTVNKKQVRAEFDWRLDRYRDLQQLAAESASNPRVLLRAIAERGGLFEKESGNAGELRDLKSGTKFGALAGVAGVFRKRETDSRGVPTKGLDFDLMLTSLQQDPQFAYLENTNMLIDAIDEAARHPIADEHVYAGTDELESDLGIDVRVPWWSDSWQPANMLDAQTIDTGERDILEPDGAVDTSFNTDEFSQSLFDDLEEPGPTEKLVADTLDTGEQQARLPGDVGTVRDQNVATPEFAAPFALTSEVARPRAGTPAAAGPSETYLAAKATADQASAVFAEATKQYRARTIDDAAFLEAKAAHDQAAAAFDAAFAKEEQRGSTRTLFQSAHELTPEDVKAWSADVKLRAGPDLQGFRIVLNGAGDLFVESLIVARGAQRAGLGSRAMQELTRFADLNGKRITLSPAQPGDIGPGEPTSTGRLVKFYKRFGFVENKGRHLDLRVSEAMYREPTLPTVLGQPFYHGSPHDFEKFSIAHTGTGEGAAAYGHGLYFAENRDVAAGYHDRLAGDPQIQRMKIGTLRWTMEQGDYSRRAGENNVENIRASLTEDLLIDVVGALGAGEGGFRAFVLEKLDAKIADYKTEWPEGVAAAEQLRAELAKPGALAIKFDPKTGGVYQVDIPEQHVAKMLDWDAPIKDQPAPVRDMVRAALIEEGYLRPADQGPRQLSSAFKAFAVERGGMAQGPTGELAYQVIATAQAHKLSADLLAQRAAIDAKYPPPTRPAGPGGWGEQPSRFEGPDAKADFNEWVRLNGAIEKNKDEGMRLASEALAAAGVPGLKYFDAGSRDQGKGTRNVVVFDESIITLTHKDGTPVTAAERKQFFQSEPTRPDVGTAQPERRGAIRFGADRQFSIALLERADLSTFLHESGHFFLEVFGDLVDRVTALDPVQRTGAQQQLVADYQTMLAALGVTSRDQIDVAQHEQFARSFEAYLGEGKAPSLELQGSFARFRAWLLGIYRALTKLNVTLTPAVRGVFDRLLASDAAIAAAEAQRGIGQMFTSAEAAQMSPAEFDLYRQTVSEASRAAREELDRKLLVEVHREQTRAWTSAREEIRAKVEAEVYAEPAQRALAMILRGEHPDGTPLDADAEPAPRPLSRSMVREDVGPERLKKLPRGVTTTAVSGLDPAVVAELFGFSSTDALLKALEDLPPARRVIEQRTRQRMIDEHGSLLLDGTLHEKAQAAVASEARDQVIKAEMRALGRLQRTVDPFVKLERAAGRSTLEQEQAERAYERRWFEAETKLKLAIQKGESQVEIDRLTAEVSTLKRNARGGAATIRAAIPAAGVMEAAAAARIADTKIKDLQPDRFWSAARRGGQAALEKAARGDYSGAIIAKQQELINIQMYRQASAALEDVADRVRMAKDLAKPSRRAQLGKAGASYLDQVDGILDRYDFAKVSQKVLDRRASLRDFAEALEAQGMPIDLPAELLDDARRMNYQDMTTAQLVGVTDGLRHLVHLAQLKNKLLTRADARDFAEVRDGVIASIREHHGERTLPMEFRAGDERARTIGDWFASHRKISDIAQAFDGYTDGGPMWSAFMLPLNEAGDAEQTRKGIAGAAFQAIRDRFYTPAEQRGFATLRAIPAIAGSLSKEARIAVALNWGNEQNRSRLLNDPQRRWTQDQVQAILDTLDRRDFEFVQATFDFLNTFWPEIAAKQERVTGLAPEKVEASPIQTIYGEFPGGYYPLAYDGRLSARAAQHEAASQAKLGTAAAYVRSTTKRGHTEARVQNVKLSVRLELSVAFNHLEQVIHDLTHHETLIDTTRLLRDPLVTKAILETHGDLVFQQLTRGLQDIAIGSTPAARTVIDKSANYLRTRTQLAMLGYNLWTALQQPIGLFNGMSRVGVGPVTRGVTRWMRDAATMESTTQWIAARSPMMAERSNTQTQDVVDLRAAFAVEGGWFDTLVRTVSRDHVTQQTILDSYLWHIGLAQRVADVPTWLGQYEKSRGAGESEERSARIADQAVLDSQGGGQVKDLAQIQRGPAVARLFMTFYSYGNTVFNATARAAGRTSFKSPAQVATFLGHVSLLYIMPAVMTTVLGRVFGKRGGDDDTPESFLIDAGKETLATALNTMVLVREFGSLVQGGARGYAGPAGTRLIQLLYDVEHQVAQGELDEALFKSINAAAGVLFRYPAAQVQRTIDGWIALEEGRSQNPGVLLVGPPPKKAK